MALKPLNFLFFDGNLSCRSITLVMYSLTIAADACWQWLERCSSSFGTSPRFHVVSQYLQEAANLPELTEAPLLISSQTLFSDRPPLFFFEEWARLLIQ